MHSLSQPLTHLSSQLDHLVCSVLPPSLTADCTSMEQNHPPLSFTTQGLPDVVCSVGKGFSFLHLDNPYSSFKVNVVYHSYIILPSSSKWELDIFPFLLPWNFIPSFIFTLSHIMLLCDGFSYSIFRWWVINATLRSLIQFQCDF